MTTDTVGESRASWKERRKLQLRDEIISVALALFEKSEIDCVSVDDIVGAIGIAKGTFYLYFKSKSDVILAVLEMEIAELEARVTAAVNSGSENAPDALRLVVRAALGFFEQHRAMVDLLLSHKGLESAQIPIENRNELRNRYNLATTSIYERIIRKGMLQGSFREVDAKIAAQGLYGMLGALVNNGIDTNVSFSETSAALFDLFEMGIKRSG